MYGNVAIETRKYHHGPSILIDGSRTCMCNSMRLYAIPACWCMSTGILLVVYLFNPLFFFGSPDLAPLHFNSTDVWYKSIWIYINLISSSWFYHAPSCLIMFFTFVFPCFPPGVASAHKGVPGYRGCGWPAIFLEKMGQVWVAMWKTKALRDTYMPYMLVAVATGFPTAPRTASVHASLRDPWGSHWSGLWLRRWSWPGQCLPVGLWQASHVQWQRFWEGEQGHREGRWWRWRGFLLRTAHWPNRHWP